MKFESRFEDEWFGMSDCVSDLTPDANVKTVANTVNNMGPFLESALFS